jgi:hypothetical protein
MLNAISTRNTPVISDTISVRVDTEKIRPLLCSRPETKGLDMDIFIERILLALERQIEGEVREFEKGNGYFEACFFESL